MKHLVQKYTLYSARETIKQVLHTFIDSSKLDLDIKKLLMKEFFSETAVDIDWWDLKIRR